MIRVLIVEDEFLIAKRTEIELIKSGIHVEGIANNVADAKNLLKTKNIDVLLLDVELGEKKTGIDLANEIREEYQVSIIYLTSFDDFNTKNEIFKSSPLGYFVKPIDYRSLVTTIEMVHSNEIQRKSQGQISIFEGKVRHSFKLSELLFMKSQRVYVEIHLTHKSQLIRKSLKEILDEVPSSSLIQINRGTLVNPGQISKSTGNRHIEIDGKSFKISSKFLTEELKQYL